VGRMVNRQGRQHRQQRAQQRRQICCCHMCKASRGRLWQRWPLARSGAHWSVMPCTASMR
jgi:hypothetical protein